MKTILKTASLVLASTMWAMSITAQEPAVTDNSPPPNSDAALTNSAVTMFYDSLAPYGEWLWVAPYGWVWSPNGVAPDWRPYTDGSWAYTDYGWTWVADVPWGWAPYHYGRWFFHEHRGWCWVPDSVWGPAWVSWHFGDAWCGWAPLPPRVALGVAVNWDALIPPFGWCFVGHGDFLRPHLREHVVLAARNVTLLRETRNVTRLEIRDQRVINASLSAEQIERFTGRRVTPLKLAEVRSATAAGLISGKELRVFRPEPKAGAVALTPRTAPAARAASPATSWEELQRHEAERARIESAQRAQHDALERWHERELQQHALPPGELQQRHEAEHRALNEQMSRERQLFEQRAATAPARPAAPARANSGGHGGLGRR